MSAEIDDGSNGGSTDTQWWERPFQALLNTTGTETGWTDIAPKFLQSKENLAILRAFVRRPAAFILGAILQVLFDGLTVMTEAVLGAIRFVYLGSNPTGATGKIGIADIPTITAGLFIDVGDVLGSAIIDVVALPGEVAIELASTAGPFAIVILAAGAGFYLITTAAVIRLTLEIGVDAIPGGGALIS